MRAATLSLAATALACLACAGLELPIPVDEVAMSTPDEPSPEPPAPEPTGPRRPEHPDAPFTAVDDIGDLLGDGQVLAAAVRGPFGPADDCVLAIVQEGDRMALHAVLSCGDEVWREGPLGTWSGDGVARIEPRDLDGDGFMELVVIGWWVAGIGPDGMEPFLYTNILGWDGTALTRDKKLESKLATKQKVDDVLAALPGGT